MLRPLNEGWGVPVQPASQGFAKATGHREDSPRGSLKRYINREIVQRAVREGVGMASTPLNRRALVRFRTVFPGSVGFRLG